MPLNSLDDTDLKKKKKQINNNGTRQKNIQYFSKYLQIRQPLQLSQVAVYGTTQVIGVQLSEDEKQYHTNESKDSKLNDIQYDHLLQCSHCDRYGAAQLVIRQPSVDKE